MTGADSRMGSVAGRVIAIRRHRRTTFLEVGLGGASTQLLLSASAEPKKGASRLRAGDIVEASGEWVRTGCGRRSLNVRAISVLARWDLAVPFRALRGYGKSNPELARTAGLLANRDAWRAIEQRARLVGALRAFLASQGFLEMQTPVLQYCHGGGICRPFVTRCNWLGRDLYPRPTAEFHLKRLIIAGFPKVYELGSCFRNEGADATHSPEFSMLEAYAAHTSWRDMMGVAGGLLRAAANEAQASWSGDSRGQRALEEGAEWGEVTYRGACRDLLGADWGDDRDVSAVLRALGPAGDRFAGISDAGILHMKIAEKLLGPRFGRPTFLTELPSVTSPLVRCTVPGGAELEKAWLFVGGLLVADIAGELTDRAELSARLLAQKELHPELAEHPRECELFCEELRLAMPPSSGMGLGVERFLMGLLGRRAIREVIPFPPSRTPARQLVAAECGSIRDRPILRARAAVAGSAVAIFAPSAPLIAPWRLRRGIACLESLGWQVRLLPTATSTSSGAGIAAPAKRRCQDLEEAFADPAVRCIFTLYGGFNCNEMLPLLDWGLLARHRKILCGYSDTTALLVALTGGTGLVTLHGPAILPEFGGQRGLEEFTERSFLAMVRGFEPPYDVPRSKVSDDRLQDWGEQAVSEGEGKEGVGGGWKWLVAGRACGRLLGGHLRTLEILCGTRLWPEWSGRILVIEECEISYPEFRRSLVHRAQVGVLESVSGIVLGRLARTPPAEVAWIHGWLSETLRPLRIPVLADVDFGHARPMVSYRLGSWLN